MANIIMADSTYFILNAKVWMEKSRANEVLIQQYRYSTKHLVIMWIKQLSTFSKIRSFRRFACACCQVCLHKQRFLVSQWYTRGIFGRTLHRLLAFPHIDLYFGSSLVWWAISARRVSLSDFLSSLANTEENLLL